MESSNTTYGYGTHNTLKPDSTPPMSERPGQHNMNNSGKAVNSSDLIKKSATEPNEDGLLLLHIACRHHPDDINIIKRALTVNRDAIRVMTASKITLPANAKFPSISSRESTQKCSLSQRLCNWSYPLHIALSTGRATLDVIHLLVQQAPDVLSKKDGKGIVPLSIALQYNASDDIILFLLHANNDAAKMPDFRLNYSLHFAAMARVSPLSLETFRLLVDVFPDAILSRNSNGKTPLDLASNVEGQEGKIDYMQTRAYDSVEFLEL